MLNSNIDPLWDNAISDTLVDDNSKSVRGDIVDTSGAPMVAFVGHTLLEGTVTFDVNNITSLVDS